MCVCELGGGDHPLNHSSSYPATVPLPVCPASHGEQVRSHGCVLSREPTNQPRTFLDNPLYRSKKKERSPSQRGKSSPSACCSSGPKPASDACCESEHHAPHGFQNSYLFSHNTREALHTLQQDTGQDREPWPLILLPASHSACSAII